MTQQKNNFSQLFEITRDALETPKARRFLNQWILANILGWSIGTLLAIVSLKVVFGISSGELTFAIENGQLVFNLSPAQLGNDGIILWLGALFGEVSGIAQWLVLRRYFPKAYHWLLVTSWSWILGSFIATSWSNLEGDNYDLLTFYPLNYLRISYKP